MSCTPDEVKALVRDLARVREDIHRNHASSTPLAEGYEEAGFWGELAFAEWSGVMFDTSTKPGGDGGIDSVIALRYSVDVKTTQKPYGLLQRKAKGFPADLYVLAERDNEAETTRLVGWVTAEEFARAPVKTSSKGIVNHHIPRDGLHPMEELGRRLVRIRGRRDEQLQA